MAREKGGKEEGRERERGRGIGERGGSASTCTCTYMNKYSHVYTCTLYMLCDCTVHVHVHDIHTAIPFSSPALLVSTAQTLWPGPPDSPVPAQSVQHACIL